MVTKNFKKLIFIFTVIAIVITLGNYLILNINSNKNNLLTTDITSPLPNDDFIDRNFYNCIIDNYNDINGTSLDYDYNLQEDRIKTITSLTCNNKGITNLQGLEKLIRLSYLSLSNNNITSIDLSHNTRLVELYIYNNYLNSIDLTNNTILETLDISNNSIDDLNLSHNPKLIELYLNNNQINDINLLSSLELVRISLEKNDLSDINLKNNTRLSYINLNNNKIETIDLSHNTALKKLYLDSNKLKNIDLSHNNNLTELSINNNNFVSNQYIYVSNEYNIDNIVKIPQSLSWDNPTYTSGDENLLQINNNKVKALEEGISYVTATLQNHYSIKYNFVGIKLKSSVYKIDEINNRILIGIDKENNINENLLINSSIIKEFNTDNTKLYLKNNNKLIKEFDIIGLASDKYKSINNIIELDEQEEISYEDFINNIKAKGTNYKIINNNEEIKSGTIKTGMNLKVYKDNDLIDTYKILYKKDNNIIDEIVKSNNTKRNNSLIIIFISGILLIIGILIIIAVFKNNKNKEDNI